MLAVLAQHLQLRACWLPLLLVVPLVVLVHLRMLAPSLFAAAALEAAGREGCWGAAEPLVAVAAVAAFAPPPAAAAAAASELQVHPAEYQRAALLLLLLAAGGGGQTQLNRLEAHVLLVLVLLLLLQMRCHVALRATLCCAQAELSAAQHVDCCTAAASAAAAAAADLAVACWAEVCGLFGRCC
jgi:hypothetical protein